MFYLIGKGFSSSYFRILRTFSGVEVSSDAICAETPLTPFRCPASGTGELEFMD
jgi:hypothetical protein